MKNNRIFALAVCAAMLCGCAAKEPETEREEYIAVYEEFTSTPPETVTEEITTTTALTPDEDLTSLSGEYEYLKNVLFIGNSQTALLTQHGLVPEENVITAEGVRADKALDHEIDGKTVREIVREKNMPYIYLWFEADVLGDEQKPETYSYKIVDLAIELREICPESMVLIMGNPAAAEDLGLTDTISDYNDTLLASVRSCPDVYVIYTQVLPAASDYNENLPEEYDSGNGKTLSSQGLQRILEYISRDRFYNDMTEDMSDEAVYAELFADRPDYTVTEGKVAYLTFDDGPSKYTRQVLDILRENDIKATFFITGWCIEGKETILKQTADEGHTIAMHSYSHDYEDIYSSVDSWLSDCLRIYRRLYGITGKKPWAFRFPGGSYNNHNRDTADELIAEMNRRGFVYYDWNAATADASTEATYESCMEYLEGSVNADHEVVLMHDSLEITPEYLQDVIDFLREKGYSFETIDTADSISF